MKNARTCIQVHGGMGYTWEMPPHYYLKRAWVLENSSATATSTASSSPDRVAAGGCPRPEGRLRVAAAYTFALYIRRRVLRP